MSEDQTNRVVEALNFLFAAAKDTPHFVLLAKRMVIEEKIASLNAENVALYSELGKKDAELAALKAEKPIAEGWIEPLPQYNFNHGSVSTLVVHAYPIEAHDGVPVSIIARKI